MPVSSAARFRWPRPGPHSSNTIPVHAFEAAAQESPPPFHASKVSRTPSTADQQSGGDAEPVVFHAAAKRHLVAGFDVPTDVSLGPENEIEHGGDAPKRTTVGAALVDQLGARAYHELELGRETSRLLEQHVHRHFGD